MCDSVRFTNVGTDSCISDANGADAQGACTFSSYVAIGNGSCLGNAACSDGTGSSAFYLTIGSGSCMGTEACNGLTSVEIGDDSCTDDSACQSIGVNVGDRWSCTCAGCCSCDDIQTNFPSGVPDDTCTALGEKNCCPTSGSPSGL